MSMDNGMCAACCGAQRLVWCRTCSAQQLTNDRGRCPVCGSDPDKPGMYLPYIPGDVHPLEPEA